MQRSRHPGADAVKQKGRLMANKWLLARRSSQLGILLLFMLGPWFDSWLIKGNLNSSLFLDTVPLTDPFVFLQSLFTGHTPEATAITGAIIVLIFYILIGGRAYCSWVCPINMITDLAQWLRDHFRITGSSTMSRQSRYWILAITLVLSFITGEIIWELVNPVSMLHRGLIFGIGLAWFIVLAVFLLDLLVSRRGWCSHLCPVGAFYSLAGKYSLVRVRADARSKCDDCMDCFMVCPEQQVIWPALKGIDKKVPGKTLGPVISSANCTNCGRCIDVCSKHVFHFGFRLNNKIQVNDTSDSDNNPITLKNTDEQFNHSTKAGVL